MSTKGGIKQLANRFGPGGHAHVPAGGGCFHSVESEGEHLATTTTISPAALASYVCSPLAGPLNKNPAGFWKTSARSSCLTAQGILLLFLCGSSRIGSCRVRRASRIKLPDTPARHVPGLALAEITGLPAQSTSGLVALRLLCAPQIAQPSRPCTCTAKFTAIRIQPRPVTHPPARRENQRKTNLRQQTQSRIRLSLPLIFSLSQP